MVYRIVIALVMMATSSYFDLKSREVADKLWLLFGAVAVASVAWEYFAGTLEPTLFLLRVVLSGVVGLSVYYFGMFGGADSKALLVMALFLESGPSFKGTLIPTATVAVFVNALFATIAIPVVIGLTNLRRIVKGEKIFEGFEHESAWRKLAISFIGYKLPVHSKSYHFKLETMKDGRKRFAFPLSANEDFATEGGVWATPGIPFLVLLTAGLIMMALHGEILQDILQVLFGSSVNRLEWPI